MTDATRAYAISDDRRVPRTLHPVAWWIWAIGLAVAVNRTTNPLLLLLVLAVLGFVVVNRRTEAPWARAFKYYLFLALFVIAMRVVFRSIFGSGITPADHIIFRLPRIPTPSVVRGRPARRPGLARGDAVGRGRRIAARHAHLLHRRRQRARQPEAGAPGAAGRALRARGRGRRLDQRGAAARRERATRRARPSAARRAQQGTPRAAQHRDPGARGRARTIAVAGRGDGLSRLRPLRSGHPHLAPDHRGADARRACSASARASYGLLDGTAPRFLGLPAILAGAALCCAGLMLGGRRVTRTNYRPDPWRAPEWIVAGCGVTTAVLLYASTSYSAAALNPSFYPLHFPPLPLVPTIAILIAAIPAFASPPPPVPASVRRDRRARRTVDEPPRRDDSDRGCRHDRVRSGHDHLRRRAARRCCAT